MRIGVDFDNTIASYDCVFHRLALEKNLIGSNVPAEKDAIRDFLRHAGREQDWTELQGEVYGTRMAEVPPFPGVIEFFAGCCRSRLPIFIISHKTARPYAGPSHDLHGPARSWLTAQGFFDPSRIGLSKDAVFFEVTRQEKLDRIASTGCTHFIDDQPELLTEPDFPPRVERFLFDPHRRQPPDSRFHAVASWRQLDEILLEGVAIVMKLKL
jgi:hypothetical protein